MSCESSKMKIAFDIGGTSKMKKILMCLILSVLTLADFVVAGDDAVNPGAVSNWPAFRGTGGQPVSADANTSISWDAKSGKGILWKADIPLPGSGSPIVFGDKVLVSGAGGNQGAIFCFDSKSGKLLWKGAITLKGKPDLFEEETTTFAPSTPVTDGKRVFAIFATGAIAAFNLDGAAAWSTDLGLPEISYGYASSPTLFNNLLIVQHDQNDEKGAVAAYDTVTGKEVWRTKRSMGASWCSPAVIETSKGPQIILVSCGGVAAYDPKDGHEIWVAKGKCSDIVPSPSFSRGLVIVTLGGSGTMAIRPDGAGDVTKTHVVWQNGEATSEVASPVAYGDFVFSASSSLLCMNISDGKKLGERELDGQFYASPIVAGGKIYLVNRDGAAMILKADKTMEVLGKTVFGEPVDATPAVSGACVFVRTLKRLICIAPAGAEAAPLPKEKTK